MIGKGSALLNEPAKATIKARKSILIGSSSPGSLVCFSHIIYYLILLNEILGI